MDVALVTSSTTTSAAIEVLDVMLRGASDSNGEIRRVHLPTAPSVTGRRDTGTDFIASADVVVFTGGDLSEACSADRSLMRRVHIDAGRQLIASQCAGALLLAALGVLEYRAVCTDPATRPLLEALGYRVLEQSFTADASVASAGGCMAAPYLGAWIGWQGFGRDAADASLRAIAPAGQPREFAEHILRGIAWAMPSGLPQLPRSSDRWSDISGTGAAKCCRASSA